MGRGKSLYLHNYIMKKEKFVLELDYAELQNMRLSCIHVLKRESVKTKDGVAV